MSDFHTGVYVNETGHVLAAFSSRSNPKGEFSDDDKAAILGQGVLVRLLTPAPQRYPFLIAFEKELFQFQFPTKLFPDPPPAGGRTYEFTDPPDASWMNINEDTGFCFGTPPAGSFGLHTISVTAKNVSNTVGIPQEFKLRVVSAQPFKENSTISFLVEGDQLSLFTGNVTDDIVRRPRTYKFDEDEKNFIPMSNPADRKKLIFRLTNDELIVRLAADEGVNQSQKDISIWALLRTTHTEQINTGQIAKDDAVASIGFTLDPNTQYEILVLVADYDPFFMEMSPGDLDIEWPVTVE